MCVLDDYIIVAGSGGVAEGGLSPIVEEDSQEAECVIKKENRS